MSRTAAPRRSLCLIMVTSSNRKIQSEGALFTLVLPHSYENGHRWM